LLDAGPASSGEWIFLVAVLMIVVAIFTVYVWADRRYRNPATGLRRRAKRRRARGPLRSHGP
jgi:ABC-type amino acid transport system permease subunit